MDSIFTSHIAASLSSSVPDSAGINVAPWIVVLVYSVFILIPFVTFVVSSTLNICDGVGVALAKYITRNSTRILIYHGVLTLLLVINSFLAANGGLHLERDLGYYTAVSTGSNQDYYAAQDATFETAFRNYHGTRRRTSTFDTDNISALMDTSGGNGDSNTPGRTGPANRPSSVIRIPHAAKRRHLAAYASGTDIVLAYHLGGWGNILTTDGLTAACLAERAILAKFGSCMGEVSKASVLPVVFRDDCNFTVSYAMALDTLKSPLNEAFVQDGFDYSALKPDSAVLLSYFNWNCQGYTYPQFRDKMAKLLRGVSVEVTHAQIDLIHDESTLVIYADVQLACAAMIAAFMVIGYYYALVGAAVVCGVVTAVIVATSILVDYGYISYSVANMLGFLIISIVLTIHSFTFVEAWERIYKKTSPLNRHGQPCRLSHKYLLATWKTVQVPMNILFGISITSFLLLHYLSPIISVSQLGLFLTTALIASYVFFHVITIPAWITIIRFRRLTQATELLGIAHIRQIEHGGIAEDEVEENDLYGSVGDMSQLGVGTRTGGRNDGDGISVYSVRSGPRPSAAAPGGGDDISVLTEETSYYVGPQRSSSPSVGISPRPGSIRLNPPIPPQSRRATSRRMPAPGGAIIREESPNNSQDEDDDDIPDDNTVETQRRRQAAAASLRVVRPSGGSTRGSGDMGDDNRSVNSSTRRNASGRSEGRFASVPTQDHGRSGSLPFSFQRGPLPNEISAPADPSIIRAVIGEEEEYDNDNSMNGVPLATPSASGRGGDLENGTVDMSGVFQPLENITVYDAAGRHARDAVVDAVYASEMYDSRNQSRKVARMPRAVTWPVLVVLVVACIYGPIYLASDGAHVNMSPALPRLVRLSENQGEILNIGAKYRHGLLQFEGSMGSTENEVMYVATASPTPTSERRTLHFDTTTQNKLYSTSSHSSSNSVLSSSAALPTANDLTPTFSPTSSLPTESPTISPTAVPSRSVSPSGVPSCHPISMPTFIPISTPSAVPTEHPSSMPSVSNHPSAVPTSTPTPQTKSTRFTARLCYGISSDHKYRDSAIRAQYDASQFHSYVDGGMFLSDLGEVCDYLVSHSSQLDIDGTTYTTADCLYSQLEDIMRSTGTSDVFQALYRWAINDTGGGNKDNLNSVGVIPQGASGHGNFGPAKAFHLVWVCEDVPGLSETRSMYDSMHHATDRADRWEKGLTRQAKNAAAEGVPVHVTSNAWLFPTSYEEFKLSVLYSLLLVLAVYIGLSLIFTGGDVKYTAVLLLSGVLISLITLVLHHYVVSDVIDPNNFTAIFLLSGCIVYVPMQMGARYHFTVSRIPLENRKPDFQLALCKILWRSSLIQCLVIILSSLPLLFAQFSIVVKTGQYGIIVGFVSALYVCAVLPVLLRMAEESRIVPVEKYLT